MLNRKNNRNLAVIFTFILTGAFLFALFCFVPPALAQDQYLTNTADLVLPGVGLRVGLVEMIVRIINIFLGVLGLIAVILLIYAGYLWMTAQGDDQKVERAKKIITGCIAGLIVILLSFIIVRTVINAVHGWAENQIENVCGGGGGCGGGGLPVIDDNVSDPYKFQVNDINSSHSGEQANQQVRLCSTIQTLFNNSVKSDSFANVKSSALKIMEIRNGAEVNFSSADNWFNASNVIQYKLNGAEFSPNTTYKLYLPTALKDVRNNNLSDCRAANCAQSGDNYVWQFQTGTERDAVAPQITAVEPANNSTGLSLAPLIRLSLSEEIDATTVNANNIKVLTDTGQEITTLTPFAVLGQTISFGFENDLQEFKKYRVRVSNLADLCGNIMSPATYEFEFTTGNQGSGFTSYYPTGENICATTKIYFSFGTSLGFQRVLFSLQVGQETKQLILNAPLLNGGVASVSLANFGTLAAVNSSFTAYEFIPAKEFLPGSSYQIKIITDKKISAGGSVLSKDWSFKTGSAAGCLCAPYLSHLSPERGGVGQCVTLVGQCLDGSTSKIFFNAKSAPVLSQNAENIVAQVPAGIKISDQNEVFASVTKTVSSATEEIATNKKNFYGLDSAASQICLLNLNPTYGFIYSAVTATGKNFGASAGQLIFHFDHPAVITQWSNEKIQTKVPLAATTGEVFAKNASDQISNGLLFTVGATAVYRLAVINDNRCEISGNSILNSPSPSPKRDQSNVCPNVVISARFNKKINDATLTNHVKVVACDATGANCAQEISGQLSVFAFDTESEGFSFVPQQNLTAGKFYQVTIEKSVQDDNGVGLAEDYLWQFKTSASDGVCQAQYVDVNPVAFTAAQPGQRVPYEAAALAAGCQALKVTTGWSWNSSNQNIATVAATAANNTQRAVATLTTDIKNGATNISATLNNKTDQGVLTYQPGPDAAAAFFNLLAKNPGANATNVCPNSVVQMTFDNLLAATSVNSETVKLYFATSTTAGNTNCLNSTARLESKNWLARISSFWKKIFHHAQAAESFWCPAAYGLSVFSGQERETLVNLAPVGLLASNSQYLVVIKGGTDGLRSLTGAVLKNDISWNFSTQSSVCKITDVKINPASHVFTQAGAQNTFTASVLGQNSSGVANVLQNSGQLPFLVSWSKIDPQNIIRAVDSQTSSQEVTAQNVEGQASLKALAKTAAGVSAALVSQATGSANITNFFCTDPVIIDGGENAAHYLTIYCRDTGGIKLPGTHSVHTSINNNPAVNNLLSEKFIVLADTNGDAVGIRVYSNPQKLSPAAWYRQQTPNATAEPTALTVGHYPAARVDRSVYIAALNVYNNIVYHNIYLVTYNNNATVATQNIFAQLLANWQFNENLDVAERGQLQRDNQRLIDLTALKQALENYQDVNGFYPKLLAGSYQVGTSTSVWPSWNATLGAALGLTLPTDPSNNLKTPCVSGADNAQYDLATCWNETTKVFVCPFGSHIYQYRTNNGTDFQIYANMEYRAWSKNDSCEDYSIKN